MSVISGEAFKRGRMLEQALRTSGKLRKRQLKHNVCTDATLEVESEMWGLGVKFSADKNFDNDKSIKEFDCQMARALLRLHEMSIDLIKLIEITMPH